MSDDMLSAALLYAAAGFPVLPLGPRSKVPATRYGKDDATTDPADLAEWWRGHPHCNVGLRPPPGMVVIDVDRHGAEDGLANLLRIAAGRPLPATLTALTGGGGLHLLLRARGPFRGQLCPGVDLKSEAGYIVAAPSIHPNGRSYQWINPGAPIVPAPRWLERLMQRPTPLARRTVLLPRRDNNGLVRAVAQAAEGERNRILFWAACRAAEDGTLHQLRADLIDAATTAGLSHREAEQAVASAERETR